MCPILRLPHFKACDSCCVQTAVGYEFVLPGLSASLLRTSLPTSAITDTWEFLVPESAFPEEKWGSYRLHVNGTGGISFNRTTNGITVQTNTRKVFIQTDKPVYKPGQLGKWTLTFSLLEVIPASLRYSSELEYFGPSKKIDLGLTKVAFDLALHSQFCCIQAKSFS